MALRNKFSQRASFAAALIGAPLAVAVLGGAFLLLDRFALGGALYLAGTFLLLAVAFGAPSYLLAGGYFFWRAKRLGKRRALDYALAGFVANFAALILSIPIVSVANLIFEFAPNPGAAVFLAVIIHAFGLVFAPAFGFIFGWIFTSMATEIGPAPPEAEEVAAVFR